MIVFLVVLSHSGCNIHIIEVLQCALCSSGSRPKKENVSAAKG